MAELAQDDSFRLTMRGVCKRFGPTEALAGVDLCVGVGEVHALIGENGAGKSTLMNVLSGSVRPDAGSFELDGVPYDVRNPHDARSQGVAMIHQELALAQHLTVEENLFLGVEKLRFGIVQRSDMRAAAREALRELQHEDIAPSAKVATLSIAAQQIVEIARALILDTRVLILDEPTSSLPQTDVESLFRLIRRLKARGLSIIYISHFLEEVRAIADRYTVLRDGKSVDAGEIESTTMDKIIRLMVGREVTEMFPRSDRVLGEVLIEVNALAGDRLPLDAGFKLRRGEVLGLAGLMGAGRTEMVRAVFGLDAVQHGEVRVGAYQGGASPSARLSQGVGLLSENRKDEGLATGLSVADNLTLSRLEGLGPAGLVVPSRMWSESRTWIDRLSVTCRAPSQVVAELSGGNQQKLMLGRLLYHDVDVLLLDEPTRGIDVASKSEIYRIIDEQASNKGKGVLMISSYLPELIGICDRIAVMSRGVLGPARDIGDIDKTSIMAECTGQQAVCGRE